MSKGIEIKNRHFIGRDKEKIVYVKQTFSGNSSSDEPVHRAHHKHFGRDPTVIASSELSNVGEAAKIDFEVSVSEVPVVIGNCTYFGFGTMGHNEYIVCIEGNDAQAAKIRLSAFRLLSSIKQYYDEKHDRANFIKTSFSTTFSRATFILSPASFISFRNFPRCHAHPHRKPQRRFGL